MIRADDYFRFGIEVEFLLTPREKRRFSDIEAFGAFVLCCYQIKKDKSWPDMHIDFDGSYKGKNHTIEWSFSDDESISPEKNVDYPIELVSPILHFKQGDHFRDYVKGVWDRIEAFNEHFKDKTVQDAIAMVDGIGESHKAIVELMNPPGGFPEPDRFYTWNFANLADDGILTIEFRQGEGVVTPTGALAWAEFVVTFVGAAVTVANTYNDLKKFDPNVHGLKEFLKRGVVTGVSDKTLLEEITGRAKDSAGVNGSDPGELSKERADKLAKKRKEDEHKQIFAKKVAEDKKRKK
ncbi:hypothetical protein BDM02DRAFT_3131553 [Thelephora ganbajun]|uniref:Uncharacterized protein n=1 Tax=Thelephora ganbajun TaxID=370292 RepID=A0ACB6Z597_THEGA|nr:hypothetical protein BDM02DRAFT_3131553 [Thelephora ganbajun]